MDLYLKKKEIDYEKMSADGEKLTVVIKPGGAFGIGKKTKQIENPALVSFNGRLKKARGRFMTPFMKAKEAARGEVAAEAGTEKKCKGLAQEECINKDNINDCHWKPFGTRPVIGVPHPLDGLEAGCYPVKKTKDLGINIKIPKGITQGDSFNITPRALSLLYDNEKEYDSAPSKFDSREDGGAGGESKSVRGKGGGRKRRRTKRKKRRKTRRKSRRKTRKKRGGVFKKGDKVTPKNKYKNKFDVIVAYRGQKWLIEDKGAGGVVLSKILLKDESPRLAASLWDDVNKPKLTVDNEDLNKQWQLWEVYNNQKIVEQMFDDSLDLKLSPPTEYDNPDSKLPRGHLGEKGPGSIEMTQYKKTSGGRKRRKTKRRKRRKRRKTRRKRK